ncbi:hypothetical protein PSYRMG_03780 [Pseudomonas syringae UMAF0158]|nr:hypothetical protein PSYRMG_03780 [Pseudomonas syringae UMAF0158]
MVHRRSGVIDIPDTTHFTVSLELFVIESLALQRPGHAKPARPASDNAYRVGAIVDLVVVAHFVFLGFYSENPKLAKEP